MATEEVSDAKQEVAAALSAKGGKSRKLMMIAAAAGVVALCGVGGALVGRMGPQSAAGDSGDSKPADQSSETALDDLGYIDFEEVVVNLNERGAQRYVRVVVTLAVPKGEIATADERIKKRLPELKNELTVYLSGCTLEDVRGPNNLNRLRREIADLFNQRLSPDGALLISHVLFKDFQIQ